jgi:hypothetical protein
MATAQKICIVCQQDVAGKKRVKDPQGHYYCEPCFAAKRDALRQARPAVAAAPAAGGGELLPDLPTDLGPVDIAAAPTPPPPADDGMIDLAPEVKPAAARQENMFGCAGCKKLVPERQIRNVDGEFVCTGCFAKRNQASRPSAPAKFKGKAAEEGDEGAAEGFSHTLSGGLMISAGIMVAYFFVMFGLNLAMPESKHESGVLVAGIMATVFTVFMVFRAVALIGSMFVAAQIMGGISFGLLGPVLYKSVGLFSAFTLFNFFADRFEGLWMISVGFNGVLLLIGFIVLFGLDFFEAMLLSFVNFFVSIGLGIGAIVVAGLLLSAFHVGGDLDIEGPAIRHVQPGDKDEDDDEEMPTAPPHAEDPAPALDAN